MKIYSYVLCTMAMLGLNAVKAVTETDLAVNSSQEGTSVSRDWIHYKTNAVEATFGEARVTLVENDQKADPDLYAAYKTSDDFYVNQSNAVWSDLSTDPYHSIAIPPSTDANDQVYSIGVYEYTLNTTSYTIGFKTYDCPNENCGGTNAGTCDATTHTCTCTGVYDWSGGGSDCKYPLYKDLAIGETSTKVLNEKYSTSYFHFKALNTSVSQVSFVLNRDEANGPYRMFATRGHYSARVPKPDVDGYDYTFVGYSTGTTGKITIPNEAYAASDWVISVVSYSGSFNYTVGSTLHYCPNDCSGNGTCIKEEMKCECNQGFGLDDCSLVTKSLDFNGFNVTLSNYETAYYTFNVSAASATRNIALSVHLEVKTDASQVGEIPVIYVNKDSTPTSKNYIFRSAMPLSRFQQVQLPVHQFSTTGTWFIAVVHSEFAEIDLHISLSRTPYCPNSCSGNGSCTDLAVCICNSGYIGVDCGIKEESGQVHWTIVAVVVILSLITGMFISHYFIKKDSGPASAPEASGVQYAQLDA